MKYKMYMIQYRKWEELEIYQKGFCNVRGHLVYNIHGKDEQGHKCMNNVSKDVWDRFDVPVIEFAVRKKQSRKEKEKILNREKKTWTRKIDKTTRKIENNEIEQWLAEHNGLDLNNLLEENKK